MKIKGITVTQDDDMITIEGESGEYDGFIEDDGTISFSVIWENYHFNDDNWKDILKKSHVFVKIIDEIGGVIEARGDCVMITVEANKLLN